MFRDHSFPVEIVLKPGPAGTLPADMAASGRVYLVENAAPGQPFLRVCAHPDGYGRHTTVPACALDLKATMAIM